jgi:hypothetical protein
MGEGYAATIQREGDMPVVGGGGSLMTYSDSPDIKNMSWQFCHTLRLTFLRLTFKIPLALKVKGF